MVALLSNNINNSEFFMKHISAFFLMVLLSALMFVSCSTAKKISGSERDGLTFETAIIAKSINSEYEWIRNNYPDSQIEAQILTNHKGKHYDVLTIGLPSGEKKNIYFDISGFFGKKF